jgi:outer membrane protein TolC
MKIVLTILFAVLLTTTLFSQTLDLEQARLLALASSRSLAKYEMSIRSSVLDERNQLYSMLPSVSAGYDASMFYLRNWKFLNPLDTFSVGANLSITQIIFAGGKSFIQKAISGIATESVRKDALAEYYNVLDSIDNAYYAVLEAEATLEADEAALEAATLALSIAEVRQSNGMINQGDYLKALADKEARENTRNQARRSLALNITRLKNLMGFDGKLELEHIDFNDYEDLLLRLSAISDEDTDVLFEEIWKRIINYNPSLSKAGLNLHRAEYNYSLSKRDYAPTVRATIFGTRLGYSTAGGFESTSSGGLTIEGTIPLDFWVLTNRLEKSRLARDSAALDYTNAELTLETELQTALLNIYSQAGNVLSTRRSLEYTQNSFNYVLERYRLGQGSVSDMSDATSLFINSRNSHIRAVYGFLQGLSRLRSLGAIDEEAKLLDLLMGRE